MILTEDEAALKNCPVKDTAPKCEGAACMGWRWVGWRDATTEAVFTRRRCPDDERVGTCGFKAPHEVKP
jgi:hypothetical protein